MTISPMPELATGLTNVAIILSAAICLLSLPRTSRQWRLLFALLAVGAVCGATVHCLILPDGVEKALWLGFDLIIAPALAQLPLAAWGDLQGEAKPGVKLSVWILAGTVSLIAAILLFAQGFSRQFPLLAAWGAAAIAAFFVAELLRLKRQGGRRPVLALLGVGLILGFCLSWLLGDYVLHLGGWQINQAALMHLGTALALPLLRLSAEG